MLLVFLLEKVLEYLKIVLEGFLFADVVLCNLFMIFINFILLHLINILLHLLFLSNQLLNIHIFFQQDFIFYYFSYSFHIKFSHLHYVRFWSVLIRSQWLCYFILNYFFVELNHSLVKVSGWCWSYFATSSVKNVWLVLNSGCFLKTKLLNEIFFYLEIGLV